MPATFAFFPAVAARLAAAFAGLALAACAPPSPAPSTRPASPTMTTRDTAPDAPTETATLAAGCFWCVEAVLERVEGVVAVESGYMGGTLDNPTYEQVCSKQTGHAEVVRVEFDPRAMPYAELLDVFFQLHDPTTLNRQGNDVGPQYRSAIFFHSDAQRDAARDAVTRWQPKHRDPIVTEVTAASTFWPAEGYHQDYWAKNPGDRYCNAFIPQKLKKLGLDR